MSVTWVTEESELIDLIQSNELVVVDFTAPSWCGPCIKFAPHYESVSNQSDATFVAVDVDDAPWAMTSYSIQSVPTVLAFGESAVELKSRTALSLLQEIESL